MKIIAKALLAGAFALGVGLSGPASAASYTIAATSSDFGAGLWTETIPFTAYFDLSGYTGIMSAVLSVQAHDVNVDGGEINQLRMNDFGVGFLAGESGRASWTTITLRTGRLVENAVNTLTSYAFMPPGSNAGYAILSASLTFDATATPLPSPGPIAGAGLPLLLAGAAWVARRRKAA